MNDTPHAHAARLLGARGAPGHTLVMRQVLEHSLDIAVELINSGSIDQRLRTLRDDPTRVLSRVDSIDSGVQELIEAARTVRPALQCWPDTVSRQTARAVAEIGFEIGSANDLDQMISTLRSRTDKRPDGLRIGLDTAIAVLEDGASTIYSEEFWADQVVYSEKKDGGAKKDAKDLAKADAAGAVIGGLGGAAVGGIGAGPGAVGGAVATSTAKAVEKVVDAIVDWLW